MAALIAFFQSPEGTMLISAAVGWLARHYNIHTKIGAMLSPAPVPVPAPPAPPKV
jgi:hypothetical protein